LFTFATAVVKRIPSQHTPSCGTETAQDGSARRSTDGPVKLSSCPPVEVAASARRSAAARETVLVELGWIVGAVQSAQVGVSGSRFTAADLTSRRLYRSSTGPKSRGLLGHAWTTGGRVVMLTSLTLTGSENDGEVGGSQPAQEVELAADGR